MKKFWLSAFCALASVIAFVANGEEFFLKNHDAWSSIGDPAAWGVGTTSSATNPDNLIPGEDDYIVYYGSGCYGWSQYLDLSETQDHPSNVWTVRGFYKPDGDNFDLYNPCWLVIRNGTLQFSESYTNTWNKLRVQSGAKFVVMDTASSRLGRSGCGNIMQVQSGGELYLGGELHLRNPMLTNATGATTTIKPSALYFDFEATSAVDKDHDRYIDNFGTMSMPNGFVIGAPINKAPATQYINDPPVLKIYQRAGTLTVGGDIGTTDTNGGKVYVELSGGTLVANESLTFEKTTGSMPAGSTVVIELAAGKTIDLSNFTFAENTTLTISGAGKVLFGATVPTTLNLSDVTDVTFKQSVALGTVTGYADVNFTMVQPADRRDFTITTADATLLTKLQTEAPVWTGREWEISGDALISHVTDSKVFIWKTNEASYRPFTNPSYWLEGKTYDTAVAANDSPGERDWIGFAANTATEETYSLRQAYDLEGKHIKVKGIDATGVKQGYGYRYRDFLNGTFEFTESYYAHRDFVTINSNAKFILASTCASQVEWGGAQNEYTVNGELDWQGTISMCCLRILGNAGSTVNFAPSAIELNTGALTGAPSWFDNSGTMKFPNGLAFTGVKDRIQDHIFNFYQRAGEMIVGGDFTDSQYAHDDTYTFDLIGGQLTVTGDSAFTLFDSYGMLTENATATIDIAAGKTLDWRKATFAEGTTLNLTGAGKIILGASQPATINISGTTEIAFSESVTLNTITGYETSSFSVVTASRCDLEIITSDATLRAKIAEGSAGAGRAWDDTGANLKSYVTSSKIFVWYATTGTYRSFSDSNYWREGKLLDQATATTVYPGDRDWIGFVANSTGAFADFTQCYDLDGKHYKVKGINTEDIPEGNIPGKPSQGYGSRERGFMNGTMEFTESYYAHRDKVTIAADGKFVIAPTCASDVQWGGAENWYKVSGELDWQGTISFCSLRIYGYAGSTVNFAPSAISLNAGAGTAFSTFDNSGTMKFPNGLNFTGVSRTASHPLSFYQRAGEMIVGGSFTSGSAYIDNDVFTFDLIGGQLTVTDDSNFSLFDRYGMPTNDSTATIDIAADKILDWSKATFASGTTLNVTGAGTIVLGDDYPATLNLGEGVKLGFGTDVSLDGKNITGLADANFVVVTSPSNPRQFMVTSSDDDVKAKLQAMVVPEGWTKELVANGVKFSLPPEVFIWMTSTSVRRFDNPGCWSTGTVENVDINPNKWIPGPQDMLLYGAGAVYKKLYLDMNGKTCQLDGIYGDGANWNTHDMSVENGTLEFVSNFSNYYYLATIKDTGKLVLGAQSVSRLGYSGAQNNYTIQPGGELDWLGAIEICNSRVYVDAGGTFVFNPTAFTFFREADENSKIYRRGIFNSGTMNAPNGIIVHGSDNPTSAMQNNPMIYTVQNLDGATLNLGGDIKYTGGTGRLRLDVQGGTINVSDDAAIEGLDAVTFDNAVTINVTAGKTFDMSAATFGSASALTVDGAIKLGAAQPVSMTLAAGSAVTFTELNTTLGTIVGYADATFAFDGELQHNQPVLISADATMLAALKDKLSAPSGWSFAIDGNRIVAVMGEPDPASVICFQCEGEKSLGDDTGSWNTQGGAVPPSGNVFVSGANTIAVLDADTVVYDSISVMRGATLKITGTVSSLPAITLYYGSKLLFADGSSVTLANAISGIATEAGLPMVEVASGAAVYVSDGYEFKNMHLKNSGTMQFAGKAYIGTAEVGETALFQLTAEGGAFDFQQNGHPYAVSWVSPKAAGGCVHVVGKVSLKNSRVYSSNYKSFGCSVSQNNPVSEVYDFELDNTTLMLESNQSEYFGGGVKFKCFNGGRIEKSPSSTSPGVYGEPNFIGAAQATFDGEESRFVYFYNRYKVRIRHDNATEAMTFKNGAYLHMMSFTGSGNATIGFEDGYWDITELPGYDVNYWGEVPRSELYKYLVEPFTGLSSVRIGNGKFLGIRAFSLNEFSKSGGVIVDNRQWNRKMKLANVPVTGENGSMFVVNSTTNQSLSVTLTCGSNTATGDLWAEPSEWGCELMLADGSNWAGTLKASETIGFTNLTDAAAAASVTVGNLDFNGRLPIRVWKGTSNVADQLTILGSLTKTKGGFAPVVMSGTPAIGDTFTVGTIPTANLPADYERKFTSSKWRLAAEGEGDTKTLQLVYDPAGAFFLVK